MWWQGNRYGVLGEDAHILPMGGRIPLQELKGGPYGPRRTMPYVKLGSYRGTVVEERRSLGVDHPSASAAWGNRAHAKLC